MRTNFTVSHIHIIKLRHPPCYLTNIPNEDNNCIGKTTDPIITNQACLLGMNYIQHCKINFASFSLKSTVK